MSVVMVMIDGAQSGDYNALSFVDKMQECGTLNNTPLGRETDSLSCIMNLLGVSPMDIPAGRAYLELLASGNGISENDLVFRCNGVQIEQNALTSSCISRELPLMHEEERLISLGGYKNLLLIKNGRDQFEAITTCPPHNHIGENIEKYLPKAADKKMENFLRELIVTHQLWPWGQAIKTKIPKFYELHQLSGAAVCQTEIVRGIAKAMGFFCPQLKAATAEIDTDLDEKARTACALSQEYDFTLLHINGADEAAHRKDITQKNNFITRIDRELIAYLMEYLPKETALIILSDHATDAKTGEHKNEPVNYYVFNKNKECARWLKRL